MKGEARMLRKFWLAAWFAALCAMAGPALAESTLAVVVDAVPMADNATVMPIDAEPPLPEPMESLPPAAAGQGGVPVSLAADQLDYDGATGVFHARGAVSL